MCSCSWHILSVLSNKNQVLCLGLLAAPDGTALARARARPRALGPRRALLAQEVFAVVLCFLHAARGDTEHQHHKQEQYERQAVYSLVLEPGAGRGSRKARHEQGSPARASHAPASAAGHVQTDVNRVCVRLANLQASVQEPGALDEACELAEGLGEGLVEGLGS